MSSYPYEMPTVTADYTTISNFMKNPTAVSLMVNTMAREEWYAGELLRGTQTIEGGAVVFTEDDASPITDDAFSVVAPGAEYPLTNFGEGTRKVVPAEKEGQKIFITDEHIKRSGFDVVRRALSTLTNRGVMGINTAAVTAITSSVTATVANSGTLWSAANAEILYDLQLVDAYFRNMKRGYNVNTLLMDTATYARMVSHKTITDVMTREGRDNVFYTGKIDRVAGKYNVISTTDLAAPGVWAFDANLLGGIAREQLPAEGYTGAPIEVKTYREPGQDAWYVQARNTSVAYVQAPLAGVRLTGAVA